MKKKYCSYTESSIFLGVPMNIKDYIAEFQDFPQQGINFKDISPILRCPEALDFVCNKMAYECRDADVIAALDARGFIFAPMIAQRLAIPWIMIRKKGKLPGETVGVDYDLEYGSNSIEMQKDAVQPGQKVALVDDLLATGGTAGAACELLVSQGAEICAMSFVISLDDAFLSQGKARKNLLQYNVSCVVSYDD